MARKTRNQLSVNRPSLSDAYTTAMVKFIMVTKGADEATAKEFVAEVIKTDVKLPKMTVIRSLAHGKIRDQILSFADFSKIMQTSVMSPSGSLYKPVNIMRAMVGVLIKEGLAFRKQVKKLKFIALGKGDKVAAAGYDAEQNTIKRKLNSLPGGFGSPSNLLYDKPNYNSVTSTARMLISNSFTCCEQLLAGNLPLFNEEEAFNLITICGAYGPSDEHLKGLLTNGEPAKGVAKLRYVTAHKLIAFIMEQVRLYDTAYVLSPLLLDYINNLSPERISFIYYHSNLKHVITDNEALFRPLIDSIFANPGTDKIEGIEPKQFFECNGDILAVVTTVLSKQLEGVKLNDPDVLTKWPNELCMCVSRHDYIANILEQVDTVFQSFIYHDIQFQLALHRKNMQRKAVVVSDTDSVIYTAKEWSDWYVGHTDKLEQPSYNIAALMTYWLTEANADTMAKYIMGIGAVGDDIPTVQMKNEFLYPVLMLYDIKKTYAGIIKVQEGVVLPEPDPDIKGSNIRGSSGSLEAKEFIKDFIINDVLIAATNGTIDAQKLIAKTVAFEKTIWDSVMAGEIQHLPITSVGPKDQYSNPESTAYLYAMAWNDVFGVEKGTIQPPDKLPLVKFIKKPNELTLATMQSKYPEEYKRLMEFKDMYKMPGSMFIEANQERVPEALIDLIDVRSIVYTNVSAIYLTLASLNICVGYSKDNILLSDIYGFDYGKELL